MRRITLLFSVLVLTACATTSGYWVAPPNGDRVRDNYECTLQAAAQASGAGGWSSSAPVRAAIYDTAKEQAYAQCARSRGYTWQPPR